MHCMSPDQVCAEESSNGQTEYPHVTLSIHPRTSQEVNHASVRFNWPNSCLCGAPTILLFNIHTVLCHCGVKISIAQWPRQLICKHKILDRTLPSRLLLLNKKNVETPSSSRVGGQAQNIYSQYSMTFKREIEFLCKFIARALQYFRFCDISRNYMSFERDIFPE